MDTAVELLTSRGRDQLARLAESDLDQLNYTAFTVAVSGTDFSAAGGAISDLQCDRFSFIFLMWFLFIHSFIFH